MTVTVNTDDPPMFATDLNAEYAIAARLLELDEAGVADLARAAVTASFASAETKSRLTAEIDAYAATAPSPLAALGPATTPCVVSTYVRTIGVMAESLEQRVVALEQAFRGLTRSPATDGSELPEPDLWLLQELKSHYPTDAVVFGGTATAPEGPVARQWGRTHRTGDGAGLGAGRGRAGRLSHPVRLRLLQRVLNGTATTAELAEDDSSAPPVSSTTTCAPWSPPVAHLDRPRPLEHTGAARHPLLVVIVAVSTG